MTKDILLNELKTLGIVHHEKTMLKHAGENDYYFDVKMAYGYTRILEMMADELWKIMDPRINCIASQGYGGLPLSSVIAEKHFIPHLTFVREKPKDHGRNVMLEGYIPNEKSIVGIVDDVGSTGASIVITKDAIRYTGAEIVGAYNVVKGIDFDSDKLGIPYKSLFTRNDFLQESPAKTITYES